MRDGATALVSVSVGAADAPVIFDGSKLIPARIVHYASGGGVCIALTAGTDVKTVDRATLLGPVLSCGTTNPGGTTTPEAGPQGPGVAVRFETPVVNRAGVDVVVFELHKGSGSGDPFHVAPLDAEQGRHGVTMEHYDIGPGHLSAAPVGGLGLYRAAGRLDGLDSFVEAPLGTHAASEGGFVVLAVGVDLSELGFAEGQAVEGLVLRSVAGQQTFDPAAVLGLPEANDENTFDEVPAPKPGRLLAAALEGPLAGCEEIVFAQRVSGRDHWYGNFGHYCETRSHYSNAALTIEGDMRYAFADGGCLCRLNLRTREVTAILEDAEGSIRDPHVHYDGQRILFSYRRGGSEAFHLYEIGIDGSNLVQLTDGPDSDMEPVYTPDGGIVFCSSRCHRVVPCWRTQVATLYRCEGDGSNVRMLSNNAEMENTPWMLPDGRVLYMRWEYVDRNQLLYHHLWTVNPDGTGVMVYFGNQYPGYVMIDAKPIPNTGKVVASFSPGHGRAEHMGRIAIVDPRNGPDDMSMVRMLTKGEYRDPYPLSEDLFLVADSAGIHLLGSDGSTELIYAAASGLREVQCHEPRPLRARAREPRVADRVAAAEPTGVMVLSDVYEGRNMEGVARGSVKKLLVLEQLPKPANFSGGQEPLTIGGTFTLQRILGTVPVEKDGSAYMEVPALRSIFFVALDENDLAVKRMQSFVTVQPGETVSCVGCHEPRTQAPHPRKASVLRATQHPASRIAPYQDLPGVLDFTRDVQPVLDRHCVSCHNHDQVDGGISLSGDHTPLYSTAYWTLFSKGLVLDGRNKYGNQPPRALGSAASPLMRCLEPSHHEVALSPSEKTVVRLWIDSGATYSGTYAALGSGMFPVDFPDEVVERRCGACHTAQEKTYRNFKQGAHYFQFGEQGPSQPLLDDVDDIILIRHLAYFQLGEAPLYQALCNLDAPAQSVFLRAPLAKEAGGLQRCGEAVFAGTDDADYRAILAAVETASERLHQEKRFDMAGFRPNRFYIREMQFFGILPEALPAEAPIDVYATDRRYWESLVPSH